MKKLSIFILMLIGAISVGAQTSNLATGSLHKLEITENGLYKITPAYLSSIGESSSINPKHIHIYGLGGGMLPQANSAFRWKGVQELPLYFSGNDNDVFEAGEYFLFYGEGADSQLFNETDNTFRTEKNLYARSNFYFLSVDPSKETRLMEERPSEELTDKVFINSYQHYETYEKDEVAILQTPSGRHWFGEQFNLQTEQTFSFNRQNLVPNSQVKVDVALVASSFESSSYSFALNGVDIGEMFLGSIPNSAYAKKGEWAEGVYVINSNQLPSGNSFDLTITYNRPLATSYGFLDFISVNSERALSFNGSPLQFRNFNALNFEGVEYTISGNAQNALLFDVTDPVNPFIQQMNATASQARFTVSGGVLREYLLVQGADFPTPNRVSAIANQDLLNLPTPEFLIITAPSLKAQAQRLADFRQENDGLSAQVIEVEQIFNEFSSGKQDVTAIRDFVRHLYQQSSQLKYLLLFGEGSYDYTNKLQGNINLVPVYESRESMHPVRSFTSDDYYGLLEENEGEWKETFGTEGNETLDIGIGRIPVINANEAKGVVDKIIRYSQQTVTFGTWRKEVLFVADDGDGNVHQEHAEQLAEYIEENYPKYLPERLYIDAFPKEVNASGSRAPQVRANLQRRVEEGVLILNYSGHGAESGWAGENILDNGIISSWQNMDRLPLMMTATCEFGRHDDPQRKSGAEYAITNPHGGAIALLTTTRPVYANTNLQLNRSFYSSVFKEESNGLPPRLGDVFRETKNNAIAGVVNRNFSLLGDPSMRLAYPRNEVVLITLNGEAIGENEAIKALQEVSFEGEVRNVEGLRSNFNGVLNVTVFDKPEVRYTLGTDEDSYPMPFNTLESIIFQGQVTITNGKFTFGFVVPKDIDYVLGNGKISLYAYDTSTFEDGLGEFSEILIGGSSNEVSLDTTPPTVDAYLDDESFFDGKMTGINPVLYASFFDESGINTTGVGIGHDLLATLKYESGETSEFELNSYFETDLDSYQSGSLQFPFSNLFPGKYELTITAWDTHNNPTDRTLSFIVEGSGEDIDLVKIYPNPTVSELNLSLINRKAGEPLNLQWEIIDQNGRTVHAQSFNYSASTSTINLQWNRPNGVPSGFYICRVYCVFPDEDSLSFRKYFKFVLID